MSYKVQRLPRRLSPRDVALLVDLEYACFPDDETYPKVSPNVRWWIVWRDDGKAVGFAGSRYYEPDNAMFLCRAGVLPCARGNGLQRRLIRARIRHARASGARGLMTYTRLDNCASSNNLIRCGFRLWTPSYAWAGKRDVLYWWLDT